MHEPPPKVKKKGISRRELLAGAGAVLGGALVGGAAGCNVAHCAVPGDVEGSGNETTPLWGIAVDVAQCAGRSGCRACIDACHKAHRVPAVQDSRHEIKWIWKEPFARVFPEQTHAWDAEERQRVPVLVLCNHCTQSPCTRVCPTGATWRRPDGVVAIDEHRCIGCRYCMAACPYGARSFNWETARRDPSGGDYPARSAGVVEKCNLCVERLDAGQVPLCVETCRGAGSPALTFGNLRDASSPLRRLLATRHVLRRRPALGTEPRVFYIV